QAIGLDLRCREAAGDMDRHLLQSELECGLVARVADDDHPLLINDNGLAETELADGGGHGVDGLVIPARVLLVRLDGADGAHLDLHESASSLPDSKPAG